MGIRKNFVIECDYCDEYIPVKVNFVGSITDHIIWGVESEDKDQIVEYFKEAIKKDALEAGLYKDETECLIFVCRKCNEKLKDGRIEGLETMEVV